MLNCLKIIEISLLIFITINAATDKDEEANLVLAKRALVEREREFLKKQPMSDDLKDFINRYRRKSSEQDDDEIVTEKRHKRSQNVNENLLYVIQNGQLVPFQNLKGFKRREVGTTDEPGYTVVPLVIPVNNFQQPQVKLVKTRTLDEDVEAEAKEDDSGAFASSTISSAENKKAKISEEEPTNLSDDDSNDNKTKEETQVLHKILQDVEGLMQWKHEGNKKEGVLCNINGSWISDAAGMRFDIYYQNSTRKKFRIHVADRIPPNEDGFLCDGNWTVFGEIPFLHSGMVIALAVHAKDKHIATFIGECRICEGSETVTGTWLVGRSSRDCKDQKAAHKILSDVWKREQGHTLRKKHLQEIGITADEED